MVFMAVIVVENGTAGMLLKTLPKAVKIVEMMSSHQNLMK